MERLTTNKEVTGMSMTELAYNCCYAKDRAARYRDYGLDIDARDLARKLMVEYGVWNEDDELYRECLADNSVFDEIILGHLLYDSDEVSGFIALFYRNIWAMADLRERLKEYEDLGITPDQIKELDKQYTEKCSQIKEIVKRLEKEADEARAGGNPEISGAYQIAIWTIKDITGIGGLSDEQRDLISWEKD